jgi:hypothetical protein
LTVKAVISLELECRIFDLESRRHGPKFCDVEFLPEDLPKSIVPQPEFERLIAVGANLSRRHQASN